MDQSGQTPFERNRYYAGKLLTSVDFQAEQAYMNAKRQFMNQMLLGDGVLCGLGVYSLDDMTIMIDSGMALDGLGQEIVVDHSVVKKLSTLDGFDTLETEQAVLCLQYQEKPVHPVYAVQGQDRSDGYECNRIEEGYRLFLQDAAALPPPEALETEFLSSAYLYSDEAYTAELSIPAAISCGSPVRLTFSLTCHNAAAGRFSLKADLQLPALVGPNGEHAISICLEQVQPPPGSQLRRDYWLTAQERPSPDVALMASTDQIQVTVGAEARRPADAFLLKTSIEDNPPEVLVERAIGAVSLEARIRAGRRAMVPLALLTLQRTKTAYLVEQVREDGVKHYLHTPADSALRKQYIQWFLSPALSPGPCSHSREEPPPEPAPVRRDVIYATGTCEIPLGASTRRGQIFYSEEILHGLGEGNVLIQVGMEYLSDDPRLGAMSKNTIFGDPQLFSSQSPPVCYADTAVKVMNDRGSFVVAARLSRDTTLSILPLRWVAIRMPAGEEPPKLQRMEGRSIAAVHPTVVLSVRESHFFQVKFKNMEPCPLVYELTERDSGEITADGVYTAPSREGIYEIHISCAELPLISTYAYAVVKDRGSAQS